MRGFRVLVTILYFWWLCLAEDGHGAVPEAALAATAQGVSFKARVHVGSFFFKNYILWRIVSERGLMGELIRDGTCCFNYFLANDLNRKLERLFGSSEMRGNGWACLMG